MANYAELKAAVAAAITSNGNQDITGPVLQTQLINIINSLGAGFQFAGVANPSTIPVASDINVFYLCSIPGTYTNFGGKVISSGIWIAKYAGSWEWNQVAFVDFLALYGNDIHRQYYLSPAGEDYYSGRYDIAVSPYAAITGGNIAISLVNYTQYGPAVAFYNKDKVFTHGWNPEGISYGKTAITVPSSAIQSGDVYVRTTLADDGIFTSGVYTESQLALVVSGEAKNLALKPDFLALYGEDSHVGRYLVSNGQENATERSDVSVSPYVFIDGTDLTVSLVNYSQYGPAVAFYDKYKAFTHAWIPSDQSYGKRSVTVPSSAIQDGDVYARATLADNGTFTSGVLTLARKAEDDAHAALVPDYLALFGEEPIQRYYIGPSGEAAYSGTATLAASPFVPISGGDITVSRVNFTEWGPAIAFYNSNKQFTHGWNPEGVAYGRISVTCPSSAIQEGDVYARATLADDGTFTDGFLTLAQKAENDAQGAGSSSLLPAYWLTYLAGKLPTIHAAEEDAAVEGDSFYFLTDYHIENNAGYSHKIIQYIMERTTVQNLTFGGDVFNGSATKAGALNYLREFYHRFYPVRMLGMRGNHEYNLNDGGGPSVQLSDDEIFNYLIRKEVDMVTLGTPGPLYYYRDVERLKLRYIYLDARYENSANSIDDTQIQWMKDRITELAAGWSVIVFSHQLFALVSPGSPVTQNPGYSYSGQKIITALTSISPSAEIVAIIAGHSHYDFSTDEHGFLEICTTCDTRQEYGGLPTTLGTINEQAFDVFCVNLDARTIKATRIGRGSDRNWSY